MAGILFRLAEAAIEHPDDTVRAALFPVVGEGTLRDLVREAKANDQAFRQRVRTVLRASYSSHYRRMLPRLLAVSEFRCANTRYRPVMDALDLLARCAQEISLLALHLLQSALVHINTLLVKRILSEPAWANRLTDADRRALTPCSGRTLTPTASSRSTWTQPLDLDPPAAAAATPA